jgi:4-alpha-glucanotransferase
MGPAAYRWIDDLAAAKQTWWQMLPLNPTGYADSPYQGFSAFAGNTNLISPELLIEDGLLSGADLAGVHFPAHRVDYGGVIKFKDTILDRAWSHYKGGRGRHLESAFEEFRGTHAEWLEDFALFMAIKAEAPESVWTEWPLELVRRDPKALAAQRERLGDRVQSEKFRQFLFLRQWRELKNYAHEKGIRLIGDIPIFVARDSADVWAHPEYFLLDEGGHPTAVAGVPPDYFSATGQLWGNPLYNWRALQRDYYGWWVARLRTTLELVDLVRLDHFRGFEAYWRIPAGMPTAEQGRWVKGPGARLLEALRRELNGLPIIAEDLGIITPQVEKLRDDFDLPGMRILQFAFGGAVENRFLPHNYEPNTVVYTGTHDNDTTRSWYRGLTPGEADFLRRYLARDAHDIVWDMIRLAWSSVADYAIVPLQDVLDLGNEARMNHPGTTTGNWRWRFTIESVTPYHWHRVREMTELYGRGPASGKDEAGS